MESEVPVATIADKVNVVVEASIKGSHAGKKNQRKVPKRIHKSEREKMNREHLNELFLALANALELTHLNNGKASILCEATRIVKDMLTQIECLKKENAALFSESQYMAIEKNELQDENSLLEVQIGELQSELKKTSVQPNLDLNVAPPECHQLELVSHSLEDCLRLPAVEPAQQKAASVSPIFVLPLHSDLAVYREPDTMQHAPQPISNVSKPHARYPTPADSWPSQVLER
ncbi:unnamed protein product [Ilex paraguariensis]|uniref:BHLH domain-containing protein n=1 Tax=Ilex paraguariensis TaxID=185542 RepID=A0ABC8SP60_9AQUA